MAKVKELSAKEIKAQEKKRLDKINALPLVKRNIFLTFKDYLDQLSERIDYVISQGVLLEDEVKELESLKESFSEREKKALSFFSKVQASRITVNHYDFITKGLEHPFLVTAEYREKLMSNFDVESGQLEKIARYDQVLIDSLYTAINERPLDPVARENCQEIVQDARALLKEITKAVSTISINEPEGLKSWDFVTFDMIPRFNDYISHLALVAGQGDVIQSSLFKEYERKDQVRSRIS